MPVRQLKSGKYQARVWDNENKKYVSLGTYESAQEADYAEYDAENGRMPEKVAVQPKAIPRGRQKFGVFALEVIEAKKSTWAPSTYHAHVRNLDKHLKAFHSTAVADITYSQVVKWWVATENEPGPVARKQSYSTLRMIMRRAQRLGLIVTSPCMIEGATKDFSKKRPTFHSGDVQMLVMMTDDLQLKAALLTMLGTGVRIGELLALDWGDIDLDKGKVHVHRHLTPYGLEDGTKHHSDGERVLLMPSEAADALLTLSKTTVPMPDQPVFVNAWGRRMTYKAFSTRFTPLRNAYGLQNLNPHDIRHVHLSEYGRHATLKEVMERGGHTDVASSLRYQHTDEERERQILEKMKL